MALPRTITSSSSTAGSSGGGPPSTGRFSSRMFIFEKTAVKIRKKIRMTITSSIGTMLMSFLPR